MAIIFHLDMDAFFVACETLENEKLKGKPVIVGADPRGGKGRGVVSTCSYEARKFGIHSGMPISIAYRKCPDGIYLPVNFPLYVKISKKVFYLLEKITKKIQQVSIDEAYFISDVKNYRDAKILAKKIKSKIKKDLGLTCSIGIGPNKSIAKIASDHEKPDGLTVVTTRKAKDFISDMSVRKLQGIGPKTELLLNEIGVRKIDDLEKLGEEKLREYFGRWGSHYYQLSQGLGDEHLQEYGAAKSISREHTFQEDVSDVKEIERVVVSLSKDLYDIIKKYHVSFKTIHVKVRYKGFQTYTRQISLVNPSNAKKDIVTNSMALIEPFLGEKKIRLIGIKLSGFSGEVQRSISRYL